MLRFNSSPQTVFRRTVSAFALTVAFLGSTPVHAGIHRHAQSLWPFANTVSSPAEVTLLNDGLGSLEYRLEMIERAKTSIDCMVYLFGTDDSGRMVLHALMRRAQEGVRVRVLVDWFNESGKPDIDDQGATAIARELSQRPLKGSFEIRFYNRGSLLEEGLQVNHRNHAKMLIVDRRELLAGGRNIGDDYFSLQEGGTEFIDREIAVRALESNPRSIPLQATQAFEAYWTNRKWVSKARILSESTELSEDALDAATLDPANLVDENNLREKIKSTVAKTSFTPIKANRLSFIIDRPGHAAQDRLVTPAVDRILKQTDEYLILENYAIPMSGARFHALEAVAKRGVPSLVLTNGSASFEGSAIATYTAQRESQLLRASHKFWIFSYRGQGLPGSLHVEGRKAPERTSTHTKSLVSFTKTGWFAVVGSYNFDVRSEKTNNESTLIVEDPDVASALSKDILERMKSAHPVAVAADHRLYFPDTQTYEVDRSSFVVKLINAIGLGRVLRSFY